MSEQKKKDWKPIRWSLRRKETVLELISGFLFLPLWILTISFLFGHTHLLVSDYLFTGILLLLTIINTKIFWHYCKQEYEERGRRGPPYIDE